MFLSKRRLAVLILELERAICVHSNALVNGYKIQRYAW